MTFAASVVMAAEEHHGTSGIEWVVGAATLVILLALLGGLVAFGGGRDHS